MDQDLISPPNTAAAQHVSPHHATQSKPSLVPPTPLPVFFLPHGLVSSLVPLTQTEAPAPDSLHGLSANDRRSSSSLISEPAAAVVATSLDSKVPSCRVCGISKFDSVEKQREHVKLDWHRYNLKQQLLDKKAKPISEPQFENMMQDLSSISGSDEEEDDDDEEAAAKPHTSAAAVNSNRSKDDDQEALIQSLMKKLELTVQENKKARHEDPVLVHQQQLLEQQLQEARLSPMIWFTTSLYDETVRLGIYKNALPNKGQCDNIADYLQSLQFPVEPVVKKQKNSKARREARRAAAAAEQSGEAGEKRDGDDEAHKSPDSTIDNKLEMLPTQTHSEEEEEEEEEQHEPDWIKYQKQGKQLQTNAIKPPNQARYWTLIMIGGGHFAGVVMDLAGQVSSHGRDMKVIAHKTFHRYTVRRKQGGSQASHGIANSAGARIRMYNEEALKLEVRELLDGWSHWITQSECVFVHSPGNNRRVLFYDNSVISTAERQGRLRSIPFITRRPTLSELKRAYQELTTVKVSVLTKEALDRKELAEQEALEKALEASSARSAKDQEALKKVQQEAAVPDASPELLKLIELVKKGRAEAMSSHMLKHGTDVSQALPLTTSTEYDTRRTPTILHLASHYGQAQVVKLLLEKHLADPTMTTISTLTGQKESEEEPALLGISSLTAYDIAKDKETRNAFRRAMALLPDTWDWTGLAHVPSALTPEMEADQERKAKEKTRKLLDAERERKKTREISRPTTPADQSTNSKSPSGSSSPSSASLMAKNMAAVSAANSHLSPEMRMRLERERRATAAEARMVAQRQTETIRRAVQGGENICVACGKSLEGLTPFDKFGRKFCTTDCVAKGPA
ncbi:hypothetical protein EDD21DRAFT_141102 [Dissophora ornata]|nr:hypothetical protein BGZ58_011322 [Dissophora ornata]KAI8605450.1 hypothetical protein EDD21DRAFT_141102 [Dissophora ornata]